MTELPPDLISIPQAALRIGRSSDSIYSLCRKGEFPPAIRIGGKWVVSVPRLERWLHGETGSEVVA